MRHPAYLVATLAVLACGSEPESNAPAEAPAAAAPTPPPAQRRPSFPASEQFRLGEAVALGGAASTECQKLYLGDTLVAVVETWIHTGNGAVTRRCVGTAWTGSEPTPAELAAVGTRLDGQLAEDFDGLTVDADGNLTFRPLGMTGRVTELSMAERYAAYATASEPRSAAGGGQEVDVIGVVFDLPARVPFQQYLLGTCPLRGSTPPSLPAPTWSSDARAVVFHGAAACSFADVETHPE